MERTSGSPDVKIGLIDGPVVTQHPDLAGEHLREIPGNNGGSLHAGRQHGVPARDLCRRDPVRKAEFPRTRHLPRLYSPDPPDFCRNDLGQRTHAERDARRSLRRRSSNVSTPAHE